MGKPAISGSRLTAFRRTIYQTTRLKFPIGARHARAHLRHGMGLAGAMSWALTCHHPGCFACKNHGGVAGTLEAASRKTAHFHTWIDAKRSGSRDGIPHHQLWRLQKSAVAIVAALGKSRHVPSRPSFDATTSARHEAGPHRPHSFLPRTLHHSFLMIFSRVTLHPSCRPSCRHPQCVIAAT